MGSQVDINGLTRSRRPHLIVCGNEKGGSGKTTTCMHVAIALLKAGHRVATVDLDCRQQSLTRYIANRRRWAAIADIELELPHHLNLERSDKDSASEAEAEDFATFAHLLSEVEHSCDYIVIDTPGADDYLMRLAHSMADTLITPLNDSFVDFDVLGQTDPETNAVCRISQYAAMVREARRQRRIADRCILDWVVVRNRLSPLNSLNRAKMATSIRELALRLGFRFANGISERVIFREFFPNGLTALDELAHKTLGRRPTVSHLAARQEIRDLLKSLRLPVVAEVVPLPAPPAVVPGRPAEPVAGTDAYRR